MGRRYMFSLPAVIVFTALVSLADLLLSPYLLNSHDPTKFWLGWVIGTVNFACVVWLVIRVVVAIVRMIVVRRYTKEL